MYNSSKYWSCLLQVSLTLLIVCNNIGYTELDIISNESNNINVKALQNNEFPSNKFSSLSTNNQPSIILNNDNSKLGLQNLKPCLKHSDIKQQKQNNKRVTFSLTEEQQKNITAKEHMTWKEKLKLVKRIDNNIKQNKSIQNVLPTNNINKLNSNNVSMVNKSTNQNKNIQNVKENINKLLDYNVGCDKQHTVIEALLDEAGSKKELNIQQNISNQEQENRRKEKAQAIQDLKEPTELTVTKNDVRNDIVKELKNSSVLGFKFKIILDCNDLMNNISDCEAKDNLNINAYKINEKINELFVNCPSIDNVNLYTILYKNKDDKELISKLNASAKLHHLLHGDLLKNNKEILVSQPSCTYDSCLFTPKLAKEFNDTDYNKYFRIILNASSRLFEEKDKENLKRERAFLSRKAWDHFKENKFNLFKNPLDNNITWEQFFACYQQINLLGYQQTNPTDDKHVNPADDKQQIKNEVNKITKERFQIVLDKFFNKISYEEFIKKYKSPSKLTSVEGALLQDAMEWETLKEKKECTLLQIVAPTISIIDKLEPAFTSEDNQEFYKMLLQNINVYFDCNQYVISIKNKDLFNSLFNEIIKNIEITKDNKGNSFFSDNEIKVSKTEDFKQTLTQLLISKFYKNDCLNTYFYIDENTGEFKQKLVSDKGIPYQYLDLSMFR